MSHDENLHNWEQRKCLFVVKLIDLILTQQHNSQTHMKEILETRENEAAEVASLAVWDCGSPLYDSYELVSLNHLIERHLMAMPSLGGSKRLTTKFYYPCDASSNMRSITHTKASTSVIRKWSDYVGRKFLKRRIEQGKDKRKRLRTLCGFYNTFGISRNRSTHG